LRDFRDARHGIDRDVARLTALFEAVLQTTGIDDIKVPLDCPICETPNALTPQRVAAIRMRLETSAKYRSSLENFQSALRSLKDFAERVNDNANRSRPQCLALNEDERTARGFTRSRMRELLGDDRIELLTAWENEIELYRELVIATGDAANTLTAIVRSSTGNSFDETACTSLEVALAALTTATEQLSSGRQRYMTKQEALRVTIKAEVDKSAETAGWAALIALTEKRSEWLAVLKQERARETVTRRFSQALQDLDRAREALLDEKFAALSDGISEWWALLRPEESYAFSGVQRGASGKRFIDLKARLVSGLGSAQSGVVRDAVAVFSDSELNCLGLAAFLARSCKEQCGFVVLDDPVPASDEEHRSFFVSAALSALMERSYQVILLTYDRKLWEDIQERYRHLDLSPFLLCMDGSTASAVVEPKAGTFDALFAAATPYLGNQNSEIRKLGSGRLRDAAERLCKLLLIEECRRTGDTAASISDYQGKTLGALTLLVLPLLSQNASHPGRLKALANSLNPGSHDDTVPSVSALAVARGDLIEFKKCYVIGGAT
jgi:hypothetical protein